MPAAIESAFDVAFWFADQALNNNEYLQPQKLHRLMFLAQAYFAVAYEGRKLMPAVFVADELGPLEPNVFKAFSRGRPDVDVDLFFPPEVDAFLRGIWSRFGAMNVDRLDRLIKRTPAFRQARRRGVRAEIALHDMRLSFTRAEGAPSVDRVVRPKVMVTHTGRTVRVKNWSPGTKPAVDGD